MPSVFARPNKFKGLSYSSILSADMGKLVPFYRQEVVPGDEFTHIGRKYGRITKPFKFIGSCKHTRH